MAQIEIRNRAVHDPVTDIPIVDAYMLWALLAAEEVVGKQGLNVLLRQIGLARVIDNFPPASTSATGQTRHRATGTDVRAGGPGGRQDDADLDAGAHGS